MSRSLFAATLLLAAAGLLWLLWSIAWQALTNLPSKEQLATVSTTVADAVAPRSTPAESAPEPREQRSSVRFVEKDGIVGVRVDGPLERAPAIVRVDPPPPPRIEPDLYRLVVIESAGLINARSHMIELAHIDAPSADLECTRADGAAWPCGRRARTALRRLIRRRAIECHDLKDDETPPDAPVRTATCSVANTDLAEWLVENGWAEPAGTAPDVWRELHAIAKAARRGLYNDEGR
ncbi:MAG: hypothetical protein AAFW98_06220 [Pseudomonadota bacterium]